jgi:hypothetical protein
MSQGAVVRDGNTAMAVLDFECAERFSGLRYAEE